MNNLGFRALWETNDSPLHRYFPGIPPFGWRLRTAVMPGWVRFYALPAGDRQNKKPDKKKEMLHRFDEIGFSLFGTRSEKISIVAPIRKFEGHYGQYKPNIIRDIGLELIQTDATDNQEDEGFTFDLYGGSASIDAPRVKQLVIEIMRDKIMQSVLVSDNGNVISPYEGGFDVFPKQADEIDRLRGVFSDWLSEDPSGL